jgi:hypothetical protein
LAIFIPYEKRGYCPQIQHLFIKPPYLICYLICAHGVEICIFYCVSRKSSSKLLKP